MEFIAAAAPQARAAVDAKMEGTMTNRRNDSKSSDQADRNSSQNAT